MVRVERLATSPDVEQLVAAYAPGSIRFLLDSGVRSACGRYSLVGGGPSLVLTARGRRVRLVTHAGTRELVADPFDVLRDVLGSRRILHDPACPVPFVGGAVGYLGYELRHHIERLPASGLDDLALPDLALGFYDEVWVVDHADGACYHVTRDDAAPPLGPGPGPGLVLDAARLPAREGSNFSRAEFLDGVRRVRRYVVEGDIFQANLSQRLAARLATDPWSFYRCLRRANPAPFAAFLDFGGFQVASSSPERFLRVDGARAETRPIKGTIRRSRDAREDRELAAALLASEKDRAELAMIVDLERNDLGRVCRAGSVRVADPFSLESYETVHHLVATVVGELAPGRDLVDLLRATFPGGSVTGAPKIRAMEIIDELEPHVRGVYTGACGYLGDDGRCDLNVAIRTVVLREGWACFHVGGGIVADSRPLSEYRETLLKAEAILRALGGS